MNKLSHRTVLIGMLLVCVLDSKQAQTAPSEGLQNPEILGQEPLRLPEQLPGPVQKSPEMVLPPLKLEPDVQDSLANTTRVTVRKIVLIGNQVFSDQELSRLTQPYENRIITSEQLQQLRYQLSR